jgi:ribonuclease G
MTRQNVTDGVREIMTRPCPTCDGEGVIKSEETLAIEFERRMRDLAAATQAEAVLLQMNPRVSSEFTRDDARVLHAIERETGKVFVFEGSEGLPLDHFAVVLEGTRDEVLERAVPFRVGEEVHVQIVEPHMYSPGDAVGKVDGYVISVTGGGPYVGEKHLVRIDEAGRTAAVASLLDAEPGPAADAVSTTAGAGSRSRSRSRSSRAGGSTAGASKSGGARAGGSRAGSGASRAGGSGDGGAKSESAKDESAKDESAKDESTKDGDATNGDAKPRASGASKTASDAKPADGEGAGGEQSAGNGEQNGEEDRLQSKPRRRGRRGGRRRSGAKAESAKSTSSPE